MSLQSAQIAYSVLFDKNTGLGKVNVVATEASSDVFIFLKLLLLEQKEELHLLGIH